MILDIYKDSLEYAFKDMDSVVKLGLLTLISFLIVPIFLTSGYYYRVVKTATEGMINGDEPLPEFNNWKDMFVDGLKLIVVKIVYLIIPIVVGYVSVKFSSNLSVTFVGVIVAVILYIICDIFSMVAIPNMVVNDSLKSAFDFKGLYNAISSIGGLQYFGFYIGLRIIEIVIECVLVAIALIFLILLGGISTLSGAMLNINAVTGIGLAILVVFGLIDALIVEPYLSIFDGRSIGLIYNIK